MLWAKKEAVVAKTLDPRVAHSLGEELVPHGRCSFPFGPLIEQENPCENTLLFA